MTIISLLNIWNSIMHTENDKTNKNVPKVPKFIKEIHDLCQVNFKSSQARPVRLPRARSAFTNVLPFVHPCTRARILSELVHFMILADYIYVLVIFPSQFGLWSFPLAPPLAPRSLIAGGMSRLSVLGGRGPTHRSFSADLWPPSRRNEILSSWNQLAWNSLSWRGKRPRQIPQKKVSYNWDLRRTWIATHFPANERLA